MGGFAKFTFAFIAIVLLLFAAFLFVRGRAPFGQPSPTISTAPVPPTPQPTVGSTPTVTPEAQQENPPDIAGLNYSEVTIPGSELPTPAAPVSSQASPGDYVADLNSRHLSPPIDHLQVNQFTDTFHDARGGSQHEATDIMEPRGTPVLAVDEGNIVKLFTSKKGGLTIYEFDNLQKYCYYYAHLDKYADGVKQGMLVRPGQVIGYVGSTGDADPNNPHLHFAISLLDTDKKFWKGTPLNPYPVLQKITGHN